MVTYVLTMLNIGFSKINANSIINMRIVYTKYALYYRSSHMHVQFSSLKKYGGNVW